jgi:hypothetical protein
MLSNGQPEARKLHARVNHPIIDADGHQTEFAPLIRTVRIAPAGSAQSRPIPSG